MPLLERVMKGADEDLANRVRAVLRLPQTLQKRPAQPAPQSIDAKVMAERSLKAGFVRDALKYLQLAQEDDPADFAVMLKLGWTYNMLHNDRQAIRWFDLARKSPDPKIAREANTAYQNLRPAFETFRTTVWMFPMYSSRWRDFFSYAQIKTEFHLRLADSPLRQPAFHRRLARHHRSGRPAALRRNICPRAPSFPLSEWPPAIWHGVMGWAEAGSSAGYLTGHIVPDYRGGASFSKGFGHLLKSETGGCSSKRMRTPSS